MFLGQNPQNLNGISVSRPPIFGERPYPRQFHPVGFPPFFTSRNPIFKPTHVPHPRSHVNLSRSPCLSSVSYITICNKLHITYFIICHTPIQTRPGNINGHHHHHIYIKQPYTHITGTHLTPSIFTTNLSMSPQLTYADSVTSSIPRHNITPMNLWEITEYN